MNRVKKIFNPDIFKIVIFIVSFLGVIPALSWEITPFLKLFHIYTAGVLIFDLLGERRIFHNKGRVLLFLFAGFYFITLLNNLNLFNFSGISNFCYLLINLAIVYSYGRESEKWSRIGCNIISWFITIANVVGIFMFYNKTYVYYERRGYLGMFPYENRLCGIFGNPNVLGMVCLIGISLSAILYVQSKEKKFRCIYIIEVLINFVTLLLSNSRTQIYSLIFIVAVYFAIQMLSAGVNFKTFMKACVLGAVLLVVGFGGCKLIQKGLSLTDFKYVYYYENIDMEHKVVQDPEKGNIQGGTESDRKDEVGNKQENITDEIIGQTIRRNDSGLNGRLGLWMTGVDLFLAKPLLGHGLDNHEYALYLLGLSGLPVRGNLHNVYIELLVACGLFGFLCFVIFIYLVIKEAIHNARKVRGDEQKLVLLLMAIIAGFMLDGCLDSTLIASVYPTAIAYWYIMSFLVQEIESISYKEIPNRVVHFVSKMDRAGQETFIMNLYRKIDKNTIMFDFLCTDESKGDYDDEIRALGGNIYYVKATKIKGPLKQIGKIWSVFCALKQIGGTYIFHIHTHHAMDAVGNVLAGKMAGIKIIAVHSHNNNALYHLKAHNLFKHVLSLLDVCRFACSTPAGEWMFGKDEFKILHNGLDVDVFSFSEEIRESVRSELGWHGKKIIGHIGRFNNQKNHKFLVDIFELIHKREEDTHLVLIGKGELEEEIKELVEEKGIQDAVSFLGVRNDISRLYQGMDLFLFPSIFEGLGIVLIEAQATGLYCVTSDKVVPKEAAITSLIQYVDLKENVDVWVERCLTLLRSDEVRKSKTMEVKQAQYDIAELAKQLIQYYCGGKL